MRAAIEAHGLGADVGLISKIHPVRSHSGAAEGGINAALGNASEDSPEEHAYDTVKGSDYLGDQDAIEILCNEAPDDVYQLEHWGAVFSRTGDGMAMALRVGVALEDMEMMQFHPTTLAPTGVLITEGCRGEGAYLLNSEGERFLKDYAPNAMELASRDVISRAEQTEIDEGRGVDGNVLLDLRHLGAEKILERLHGTRELSMVFAGVDPIREPIPVRPGAHYHMGGLDTDVERQTERHRRYAAGECACVSVHGANRLGGNALMETITYGNRAGRHAADWALTHTTIEVPESVEADAQMDLKNLL